MEAHLKRIDQKLRVESRTAAVARGLQDNISGKNVIPQPRSGCRTPHVLSSVFEVQFAFASVGEDGWKRLGSYSVPPLSMAIRMRSHRSATLRNARALECPRARNAA